MNSAEDTNTYFPLSQHDGGISAIKIPISTFVLAPYKRERKEIREILYILSFPHEANFPP